MPAYFPIPSLHPAGRPIIIVAVAVTLGLVMIAPLAGVIGLAFTLYVAYFFRDPDRFIPQRDGLLVSPADGRVIEIAAVTPPPELELGDHKRIRIGIFLSIFDVHVNRMAAAGRIRKKVYHPGKFLHAAADKASADNERLALTVDMDGGTGRNYAQVQIAGFIARRIICDADETQMATTGQRYGIIRFGSRVDIYLPVGIAPLVVAGQIMTGGETVLADCEADEPARQGVRQ